MRIRHAILAAAFVATSIAVPSAAHAQSGSAAAPDCPSGWLCGWTDADFGGVGSFVSSDMAAYPETTAYVGFNDGRSVWNNSATRTSGGKLWGRCAIVYSAVNYQGSSLTIMPGKGIASLPASFGHVRSNRFQECVVS
ncbi:peptidase inhibitor family I36 protein [Peterkaempfera sp. SMS 1(5)a]|uniref:peptidase inhibitor family I36 protein n=1 Tax=Peterkaempfera podocarpi TaxID=3232308 RepID=UPI00367283B6